MDRVLMVGHKKGNIECVVNLPHFGKLELVHDQG